MDLASTGSLLTKKDLQDVYLKTNLVSYLKKASKEAKEEAPEEAKKEEIKELTIDDFIDDFKI